MSVILLFLFGCLYPMILSAQCTCNGPSSQCAQINNKSLDYIACNCIAYLNEKFWKSNGWSAGYWNTANTVEASVNYLNWSCSTMTTQCNTILDHVTTTISANSKLPSTNKVWYDDLSWWSLAFLRMYEYTSDTKYLTYAVTFADYVWSHAWDTTYCNGGLWWSYQKGYKNAITNELGMTTNCKLYYLTNNGTYLDRCNMLYAWFVKSGMINNNSLINDGLSINAQNHSDCFNNNQNTWSYNQGVILGGLLYLARIDHNNSQEYIDLVWDIWFAVNKYMTDDNGVFHELVPAQQIRSSNDAQQFKGIFVRYVTYVYFLDWEDMNQFVCNQFKGLQTNAASPKCEYMFDPVWDQPYSECDSIAQTSSLDVWNWALCCLSLSK